MLLPLLLALHAAPLAAPLATDGGLAVAAAEVAEGSLAVRLSGFRNAKGKVLLALFRGGDGFPSRPDQAYRTAVLSIAGSRAQIDFSGLPAGDYAVSVIHDENNNETLDTNFLGIPKEGIGTSNNAKGRMGPPKYRDAKFTISSGAPATQRITMVYM